MMYYWRCPKCGGPSEMSQLCEKCKEKACWSNGDFIK